MLWASTTVWCNFVGEPEWILVHLRLAPMGWWNLLKSHLHSLLASLLALLSPAGIVVHKPAKVPRLVGVLFIKSSSLKFHIKLLTGNMKNTHKDSNKNKIYLREIVDDCECCRHRNEPSLNTCDVTKRKDYGEKSF